MVFIVECMVFTDAGSRTYLGCCSTSLVIKHMCLYRHGKKIFT